MLEDNQPSKDKAAPLVIWRFVDGKPGHENQTQGLIEALSESRQVETYELQPITFWQALKYYFKRSFPQQDRPMPALVMGAGHRTHLSVLAAKRSAGGQSVILMKPSLPTALFDYCIVPEHDGLSSSQRIITTLGVINRVKPSSHHDDKQGLILVGGPSTHYDWHDDALLERINMILDQDDMQWTLSTSRRTPASFIENLKSLSSDHLKIYLAEETQANWLPAQLRNAGQVWITEDSVSMVYEALSSGADCGLLPVQRKKENRVSAGVDSLIQTRRLTSFDDWMHTRKLNANEAPLCEAKRVADYLLAHV